MRIVCQKCSAAYAIDDKFVTPKGVRAQCPRCRHLQLVKREGAAAGPPAAPVPAPAPAPAAPPPAAGNGFLFDIEKTKPAAPNAATLAAMNAPATSSANAAVDLGAPPPARARASAPPAVAPVAPPAPPEPAPFAFDFSAPPPPIAPLGSIAAPPAPAAAAPMPFDFGSLPPPPPPGPAAPVSSAPFSFDLPPPPPGPQPAPVKLTGPTPEAGDAAFDLGGPTAVEIVDARCKSCGKVLTDPFDQALGTCDDCRSKVQDSTESAGAESGRIERVDTSALSARLTPSRPQPAPVVPASMTSSGGVNGAEGSSVRSAMRERERPAGRGRQIAAIAGIAVVVIAAVAFFVTRRPWERKRPPPFIRQAATSSKAIDAVVQKWRMNFPELDGATAAQAQGYVSAGEDFLAQDTTKAYADAEEAFEKALVVDNSNDRAIAGWVLAIAFGRGAQIDDQTASAAESMLAAAEQRSGEPRLYVAHAHLLLVRNGNVDHIQVMAERGKNSPNASDKALAALAIGQAMLSKNETVAGRAFDEALQLDPKLKRGYFFQARLAASVGRYHDAVTNLERRLELDPDQWEAAEALARLDVDVGEVAKARKVLEAALKASPRNARARVAIATLAYQHGGEAAQAVEVLTAVVSDRDVSKVDLADAYVHLAGAYRVLGDLGKSGEAADKALELAPESVPAKLQHFWVMVEKNVTSQARIDLDGIKGKLGDPQLDNVLEGRLLMAQNRFDEAATLLSKVHEADPRRADALLLAGAAAARAKQDGKAWEFCLKRGLKLDPWSYPVPSMTPFFVRPADVLRPATGAYASLNPNGEEDPNPELCEGMVAWFSDDLATSDRHMTRVNNIDQKNSDAYAYRAFSLLKRRDLGGAARMAAKGVDANRNGALAHFALAAALTASNKPDAAKPEAVTANKFGAWLLGPRVLMADAEARLKNADEARRLLTTVLLSDANYREAKRVLYKQAL